MGHSIDTILICMDMLILKAIYFPPPYPPSPHPTLPHLPAGLEYAYSRPA